MRFQRRFHTKRALPAFQQGALGHQRAHVGWRHACPEPVHLPFVSFLAALVAEFGSDPPGELPRWACVCGGTFGRRRRG